MQVAEEERKSLRHTIGPKGDGKRGNASHACVPGVSTAAHVSMNVEANTDTAGLPIASPAVIYTSLCM